MLRKEHGFFARMSQLALLWVLTSTAIAWCNPAWSSEVKTERTTIAKLKPSSLPTPQQQAGTVGVPNEGERVRDTLLNQSFSFATEEPTEGDGKDRPLNVYYMDGETRPAQSKSVPLFQYPNSTEGVSLKAVEPNAAFPRYRSSVSWENYTFMGAEFRFDIEDPERMEKKGSVS